VYLQPQKTVLQLIRGRNKKLLWRIYSMISQWLSLKRASIKRFLLTLTTISLIVAVSAMTSYNAGSVSRVIPSDYCDGGDCCVTSDCSCPNCYGQSHLPDGGFHQEVTVEDFPVPLFSADGRDFFVFAPMGIPAWALFNLILTATGLILSILIVLRALRQKKDEFNEFDEQAAKLMNNSCAQNEKLLSFVESEDLYSRKRRLTALESMYILSFGAALLLILTQRFNGSIAIFDFWSVFHAVIFGCVIMSGRLVFKKFERSGLGYA